MGCLRWSRRNALGERGRGLSIALERAGRGVSCSFFKVGDG